ncbi:hypothetical protein EN933_08150 [Mesorhizobium sp. M7A.F.Ca.US.001.01.1.1]|uniref:hypothetical protein n=1 Tax=unclassified Mesorhizobium TaxID=325217 RepID=UPI0007EC7AAE|nr:MULTISPECIES: hypothetical protein [unclassified Mesorhizobium]ARP65709.1 hypothetical protein A9K65_021950 [Mesorhizobium sp. WSM1497]MBZ9889211.1 hypothetical protein [Mesorhizobium sp. BR1-1-3]RVA55516.1 hypothetical protein EN933_08150 [Mesorhizobium sp. M7A.F.Ca.US.001.01.1.1]
MAKAKKALIFPRHILNEAGVIADFKKLVEDSEKSDDFKRIARAVIAEMLQYRARQNKVEAKEPVKPAPTRRLPLLATKKAATQP